MRMHYSSRKYRTLVEWIALNDSTGDDHNITEISSYLTVIMLAHCFNLPNLHVAEDVMAVRVAEAVPS